MNTNAKRTKEIQDFELINEKVVIEMASESIVLLKNDGVLPLKNKNIALYGGGAAYTLKGGVGSGEVNPRKVTSIYEAFKENNYHISSYKWLDDYISQYETKKKEYIDFMRKKAGLFNFGVLSYLLGHPFNNPMDLKIEEDKKIDEVCFYVISRQAGENVDRLNEKGDFKLSDNEVNNLTICSNIYKSVVLIINCGGYIDLSSISELNIGAIIFYGMQGASGAKALIPLIEGKMNFSGKLTATWVNSYDDVPFGNDYSILNGNTKFEDYKEGIYVGYKYYDSFNKQVRYPFGYGLSYTNFAIDGKVITDKLNLIVKVKVTNIGNYTGKEVVQVYVKLPKGKLDKEYQRLVGFIKTDDLKVNDKKEYEISFPVDRLLSYDEKLNESILEKGEYIIRIGNSSRNLKAIAKLVIDNDHIFFKHKKLTCVTFDELHSTYIDEKYDVETIKIDESLIKCITYTYAKEPPFIKDDILDKLSIKEKISLCSGDGLDIAMPKKHYFNVFGADAYTSSKVVKYGLPELAFCDGPTGLRLFDECVETSSGVRMTRPVMASFAFLPLIARNVLIKKKKEGKMYYQYATNFPVGLSLASSWNVEVAKKYARALKIEMKAFGCEHILAPGMNILRNPLCGRTYEYFSEDPILSGLFAASIVEEIQKDGNLQATIKHYLANNQEINRRYISENVSIRALRECYFTNFAIAVKYGKPKAFMTSYNKVNGTYVAESKELVNDLVRCELNYDGLIMTDWVTESYMYDSAKALKAGVNMMMPGIKSDYKQIYKEYKKDPSFIKYIDSSASLVIKRIKDSDLYKNYPKK